MKKILILMAIIFIFSMNLSVRAETLPIQNNNNNLDSQIKDLQNVVKDLNDENEKGLSPTDWVAIVAAAVALFAAFLSYSGTKKTIKASEESSKNSNEVSVKMGVLAAETQGKQRLIDTVSIQRVEWINNVRVNFSQHSKITYSIALKRAKNEEIPVELLQELVYFVNHIELFLNPTEIITKEFITQKDLVSNYILEDRSPFSWEIYSRQMHNLHYIEQVILKSEWKRLKVESKNGSEVDDMEKIHKDTAKKIDEEKYSSLLKCKYESQSI